MKAAVKGKYDNDKNAAAAASVAFNAGDVKLRASITDATFINGPSLTGLVLAVEKPGSFSIDYNVPKKVTKKKFNPFSKPNQTGSVYLFILFNFCAGFSVSIYEHC